MHYRYVVKTGIEVVKFEQFYFSADFQRKWTKFLWVVYKHPKNWKSNLFVKYLEKNIVKIAKNLMGVLWQDKSGVKKSSFKMGNILENAFFVTTPPNIKKCV